MLNISRGAASMGSVNLSGVQKPPSSKKSSKNHEVPDWMKEQIKEYANEDAKTGNYMGGVQGKFITMRKNYIKENAAPDRASMIAGVMPLLYSANPRDSVLFLLDSISGGKFNGMMSVNMFGQTHLKIYDENGDAVSKYSSNNGWQHYQTRAERTLGGELTALYYDAWQVARAKETSATTAPAPAQSGKLDVTV